MISRLLLWTSFFLAGNVLAGNYTLVTGSEDSNLVAPLGSVWKLFSHSYLIENNIKAQPYLCTGNDPDERFCCEKGKSIDAETALAKSCGPFYVQTIQLFDMILSFIFVLIGGIVLFTVGNTMSAAVVERTVEIGTLRAIGLRQAGIRHLFIIEGLILGCVGAVLGTLSAVLIGVIINNLGLTWLPPGSSERLPLNLRIWGENAMIFGTTLGLIAIAAVSAWWPAWRAAKLKIVDALRHA